MTEHRYQITAPWGDTAEADTREAAHVARRTLAADRYEQTGGRVRVEEIHVLDRGEASPFEAATA